MAKSFSNQENFYKRLRELSDVDAPSTSVPLNQQTLIEYSRANDGSALGIIKEDTNFFIKSSNTKGDIAVEHFTYIGGLENKLKYRYTSLSEAKKNMGFFISTLNESLDRKFNVALLKEEKDYLGQTNADKGVVASAQDKADKNSKGETLKTTAQQKDIADPLSKEGIANAQAEGDKKKSDDASQKLKQGHEPSATSSGAARGDIAKAQVNADATTKGSIPTTAPQKTIAEPIAKSAGAAKAQSAADANKSNDASAKIKTTSPKEVDPASDAAKQKAIVIENFGQEQEIAPEEPGAGPSGDASASAAGAEMGIPSGDENADLDAAASALDALDIKADAEATTGGDPSAMGGGLPDATSAEVPSGDMATAGAEAGGANDGIDGATDSAIGGGDPSAMGGDDAAVKDVEKLVGKTAQKVRSTELTDEMVGGLLKSVLAGFEDKLANLDSDLRREIANKILKAGEEGEGSNVSDDSVPSTSPAPDAANSPSAEPGAENLPTGGAGEEGVDPEGGEEAEPDDKEIEEAINQHLANMGKPEEGGVNTAGSGEENKTGFKKYMAERGYNGMDENISIMEMASLVTGYANECGDNYENADMQTIAEYMSPEVKKEVTECGYGSFAEGVEVFNIKPKSYKSMEPISEIHEKFEEDTIDEKKVDEKKEFPFAPAAQSLNKAAKGKEEDKKEDKDKKEEVSESAKKNLRAIIQTKIQEHLGLKKPSVNESAKSAFSKKLDEMIAAEIKKGKIDLKARRDTKNK